MRFPKPKAIWVVTYRFNDYLYVKEFSSLADAERFYNLMLEKGYNPTIHTKN